MNQFLEQSKKAGDTLEDLAKKTQEVEKASKKAQERIEKVAQQTTESIRKSTKQSKEMMEKGLMNSSQEAFHITINDEKKKKSRDKDSSDEEDGLMEEIGKDFEQLTLNQRALGALGCYVISGLFAFAATVMLVANVHHVRFYALFYSLSNIATFSSLLFIMGQTRLQKRMLSSKRSLTGRAWMSSLVLTIVVAFLWSSHWFIVIWLLLMQFGSMICYGVSYIPFGRKFLHTYMARKVVLVDALDGKIDGK